jgi:hypothetical protein
MCGRRAFPIMGRSGEEAGVAGTAGQPGRAAGRRVLQRRRWWVHLALMLSAAVSVVLEPVLTLHVALGLLFVAFVPAHLLQRRRVSLSLVRRFGSMRALLAPSGRLAVADAALTVLTAAMLASGLWDWLAGHPTRIRWHAITGVLLAGFLVGHTVRRRGRLRGSTVR